MTQMSYEETLAHYGVKGMRWGVRRARGSDGRVVETPVSVKTTPGKRVKTSGGTGQKPSEDAVRVATARQKAKKSSLDSLSNKELQELVNRMNLEQQYSRLSGGKKNAGRKFIENQLKAEGRKKLAAATAAVTGAYALGKALEGHIKVGV